MEFELGRRDGVNEAREFVRSAWTCVANRPCWKNEQSLGGIFQFAAPGEQVRLFVAFVIEEESLL